MSIYFQSLLIIEGTLPLIIPGLGVGQHKIDLLLTAEGGARTTVTISAMITATGE